MTALATSILDRNLRALMVHSADAVEAVRSTPPDPHIHILQTDDGVPVAELRTSAGAQALASRRRPLAEAAKFAEQADLTHSAVFVVAGFGVGYHVRELCRRVDGTGIVFVFEPHVGVLRAVLEQVDLSPWLGSTNLRVLTSPDDRGAMIHALQGAEGLVGMGVELHEHVPSKPRLGETTPRFYEQFTSVVESVKMTVLTSLVQVRATVRNCTQNLGHYLASPGITDLAGVCKGRPAIVVAAGPSLARNVDLLAKPGVRDRFVIIAVQTVLKTLLARGIKPHYVTALDYSEVSKRFYEGLTAADVEGVTLIAEAKVNPAVLDAFPGHIRMPSDGMLELLLNGKEPASPAARRMLPPKGELRMGATVAHLAYYVARYLGCDPVALVGQDLGFTDGQYYAAGAAIHEVWAGELNEFNTLEMLEWQRIVRMGRHLRRATDTLGRPVFTDEQMATYLTQFERDFKQDAALGLRTVDATEGGVLKQHTHVSTLADFLADCWNTNSGTGLPPVPDLLNTPAALSQPKNLTRHAEERLREARAQVWRVGELSKKAISALAEMHEHIKDQPRVNRLIDKVSSMAREVAALEPGYTLVQAFSQTAAFNRLRADRAIYLENDLSPQEVQGRQIERDRENVEALAASAEALGAMLDDSGRTLAGGPKVTRETTPSHRGTGQGNGLRDVQTPSALTTIALVAVRATCPGSVLNLTLTRLRHAKSLNRIVLLCESPADVRAKVAQPLGVDLEFVQAPCSERNKAARASIATARAFAGSCWRGGRANATCYDEVFDPHVALDSMARIGADAALVLGGDWCLIDPALADAVIARHAENPASHRLTFTQAVPGLAPCLVSRSMAQDMVKASDASPHRPPPAIGSILGYVFAAPIPDLIANPVCVQIPPIVRDAGGGVRCIPDSPRDRELVDQVIAQVGADHIATASAVTIAEAIEHVLAQHRRVPAHLALSAGVPFAEAVELVTTFTKLNPSGTLTIETSAGQTTEIQAIFPLIAHARAAGIAHVHVRTTLTCSEADAIALAGTGVSIISVDLFADEPTTYERITGRPASVFAQVRSNIEALLALDRPGLWIVPRLTRCDAAYADIETFFHRWLYHAGWAVIDPLPAPREHERIAPLPVPASVTARIARDIVRVQPATIAAARSRLQSFFR